MPDPHRIDVWMRWEFEKLNAGLVAHPKSLRRLLATPTLETREGDTIDLDRGVLDRMAAVCCPCPPDPTFRLASGRRIPRSWKNASDMLSS